MSDGENKTERKARDLSAVEEGQVAEIRLPGTGSSYWTFVRSTSSDAITVWAPELNGEPVGIAEDIPIELSITLSGPEVLLARGRVKGGGSEGDSFIGIQLDPDFSSIERRRRYLRVAAVVPVRFKRLPDGLTPWGDPIAAKTISISPGGLAAESYGIFSRGEQILVEFDFPGCKAEASAVVLEYIPGDGIASRVSLRFTFISDQSEAAITRLIYQYQRIHGAARL